jgi:hypothetical protein
MLAIPSSEGVAALSFAIAADGTLAQIVEQPTTETLRSKERQMLLPVNLLDNIRTVGDAAPAPQGTILAMSRSEDELTRDRVQVQASDNDREVVNKLKLGDMVKLYDTNSYNGLYQVRSVEDGSFTIDAPFQYNEVGRWEVMEKEDTGLVFDGIVTRYEGVQRVYDFGVNANHGIAHGSPYGGGITRSRKLGDETTLATRYSNHELFAVREGATYVETFEFCTKPAVDPKKVVNSSNSHIFKPALWGRLSRTAEDK